MSRMYVMVELCLERIFSCTPKIVASNVFSFHSQSHVNKYIGVCHRVGLHVNFHGWIRDNSDNSGQQT